MLANSPTSALLTSQQQLLERIENLCMLDSHLILVSGNSGYGKSTLAGAIIDRNPDLDLAWLDVSRCTSDDKVRHQLILQLTPQAVFDAKAVLLDEFLRHPIHAASKPWTFVFDNAHQLSNQVLVELWGLVEFARSLGKAGIRLNVILLADVAWSERIHGELEQLTDTQIPLLPIQLLLPEECRALAAIRQPAQLSLPEPVESLLQQGFLTPARVLELVETEVELDALLQETQPSPNHRLQRWLIGGSAITSVLIAAVWLMLYLPTLEQESDLDSFEDSAVQDTVTVEQQVSPPVSELASDVTWSASNDTIVTQTAEPLTSDATEQVIVSGEELAAIEQKVQQAELSTKPAELAEQTELAEQVVQQHDIFTTSPPDSGSPEETAMLSAEPVQTTPESAQANSTEQQTAEVPQSQTEAEPIKPSETEQTPPPKPVHALMQMSAKHYVLQLVVLDNRQLVDEYAQQHGLSQDPRFHYYQAERYGKNVLIGVYGGFASRKQASAARAKLPAAVRSAGPWPRTLASVQQELIELD